MKKAQAAMDFIITYGWAIFLVFAVIGTLAYFGILSPEKFNAEECYFLSPGIKCVSHNIEQGSVYLSLQNENEMDITLSSIKINECASEVSKPLAAGSKDEFQISCQTGPSGSKFKAEMEISYIEAETGFSKRAQGAIKSKVQ